MENTFGSARGSCYDYAATSGPLYNFLPTNMIYMGGTRKRWKLCINYDKDIIKDYRFSYDVKKEKTTPLSDFIKTFPDFAESIPEAIR
ncbi:hypothetical protein C7N83_05690 [Neisseria iguanae]|uniref:Uncharacterized protein n=2 Tax=Neisseria iguanae TaxID=90242 RepID=A0A2P7U0M6_9NEIS|nr:hypothetical protein C7N83_05690 [Neisseria iguanae]